MSLAHQKKFENVGQALCIITVTLGHILHMILSQSFHAIIINKNINI